jgi:two-component system phosphate regulon sensor histidine kinase PhoR
MLHRTGTKLILLYSLLIIILTLFLLFFFSNLVRDVHLKILTREMAEKIEHIALELRIDNPSPTDTIPRVSRDFPRRMSAIIGLRITLVDTSGRVIGDSSTESDAMDNHQYRQEILQAAADGSGSSIRYSNTLRTGMLYYAKKHQGLYIRVAKPLYEVDTSVATARKTVLITGIILLIIALVLNILISRYISRPITRSIEFANRFAEGDLSTRIHNYRDDEIGELQRALNHLADSMDAKISNLLIEQSKLRTVIESIHDPIAFIDSGMKIMIANKSFINLWSTGSAENTEGKLYYTIIRHSTINSKIEYSLKTQSTAFFEDQIGGLRYEVFLNTIREYSKLQGLLLVLHDITERKKIEQLKTDLVGNLSHELKTPIAIVKGYLETIGRNLDRRDMCEEFVAGALTNIDRQASIINDMLKLNMIETTSFVKEEKIHVEDIISNCVKILSPRTQGMNITLEHRRLSSPEPVNGNAFLAEEIFFNIIDNAINYNRENGSVTITTSENERNITVEIRDTGIGIPADSMDRIFERFYRVDKGRSRNTGGTGLGLAIVKHSAQLMGWDVQVSSSDAGTSFSILIPKPA